MQGGGGEGRAGLKILWDGRNSHQESSLEFFRSFPRCPPHKLHEIAAAFSRFFSLTKSWLTASPACSMLIQEGGKVAISEKDQIPFFSWRDFSLWLLLKKCALLEIASQIDIS